MAINPPVPIHRRRRCGLPLGARRVVVLAVAVLACLGTASAHAGTVAIIQTDSGSVKVSGSDVTRLGGGVTPPSGGQPAIHRTGRGSEAVGSTRTTASTRARPRGSRSQASPSQRASPTRRPREAPPWWRSAAPGAPSSRPPVPDANLSASHYVERRAPIPVAVTGETQPAAGPLTVTVTASAPQVSVGEPVYFAAQVAGAPLGAQLTYVWSFGGGPLDVAGPNVSHTYATPLDYPVSVTVTGPDGARGLGSVTVTVGHPHRSGRGSGLGSSSASGLGAGGSGTGQGGTGGGSGTAAGKGAAQRKPSPKPAVRKPAPPAHPPGATPTSTIGPPPGGSQAVRGVLLADAGSPFDLSLSPPPSGGAGAARQRGGGSSGLPAVAGGLALALAIAALGGLTERRRGILRPA